MLNTRRTKRTFSPEFRLEAIEQVVKYQRVKPDVRSALQNLVAAVNQCNEYYQGIEPAGNAITPEQREIQQIKAQIKRLEMEKEILKQAAVLMSEIPGKLSR